MALDLQDRLFRTSARQLKAADLDWRRLWIARLMVTDVAMLCVASGVALLIRVTVAPLVPGVGELTERQTYAAVGITVVWLTTLAAFDTRATHVLGVGAEEFRRIVQATLVAIGIVTIASVAFHLETSRTLTVLVFVLGLFALISGRAMWRLRLRVRRRAGDLMIPVVVIGGLDSAQQLAQRLKAKHICGFAVVGVWVPQRTSSTALMLDVDGERIPVFGPDRSLPDLLDHTRAQVAIVTDTEQLGFHGVKELTWELGEAGVQMLLSPSVMDVASSRIDLTNVASMPFLSLSEPQYTRAVGWRKALVDRIAALGLLLLLLPVLGFTAMVIRLTSAGPVLYRQERIGLDGKPFTILKFRSMYVGADARLHELLAESGAESGPMAKLDVDPRITPIGRFIRRTSIDELPQLINVLKGDMSLVGPRPQRDFEVAQYDHRARRRLTVRPGMTGLWQVSGRSDLSWEDAVKLDTYYVENCSVAGDLMILLRTVRAVLASEGAR